LEISTNIPHHRRTLAYVRGVPSQDRSAVAGFLGRIVAGEEGAGEEVAGEEVAGEENE
jgi:hypothetical protein